MDPHGRHRQHRERHRQRKSVTTAGAHGALRAGFCARGSADWRVWRRPVRSPLILTIAARPVYALTERAETGVRGRSTTGHRFDPRAA
jgi:hypothetical protein